MHTHTTQADWPKLLRMAETDAARCAAMRSLYVCSEKRGSGLQTYKPHSNGCSLGTHGMLPPWHT